MLFKTEWIVQKLLPVSSGNRNKKQLGCLLFGSWMPDTTLCRVCNNKIKILSELGFKYHDVSSLMPAREITHRSLVAPKDGTNNGETRQVRLNKDGWIPTCSTVTGPEQNCVPDPEY